MDDELNLSKDDDDGGSGDEWIVTFADMSTLLLTFFVLLFSMSTIDKHQFAQSFSSVREAFGGAQMLNVESEAEVAKDSAGVQESERSRKEIIEAQRKSFNEIRTYVSQHAIDNSVNATFDEGVITLTVPAEVLFDPGSEVLRTQALPFVHTLLNMFLKNRQQNINIKGYTDDSPIPTGSRFKDNWELSSLRAVNVLRELLKGGIEAVRLTATGLGDLDPVAPNTKEENRSKNRRVEFVLERRVTP